MDAVSRALALLDAFEVNEQTVSLTELSQRLNMLKTTVLRTARTLARSAYLAQTEEGRWRLAIPVFGAHRKLFGALCISGLTQRLPRETLASHLPLLVEAGASLSRALSANQSPLLMAGSTTWHP